MIVIVSAAYYPYESDEYRLRRYPSHNVRLQRFRDAAREYDDIPLRRRSHQLSDYERRYNNYLKAQALRKREAEERAKRFYEYNHAFDQPSEALQERELTAVGPEKEPEIIPEQDVKETKKADEIDGEENEDDREPELKVVEVIEKNDKKGIKDSMDAKKKLGDEDPIVKDIQVKDEPKEKVTKELKIEDEATTKDEPKKEKLAAKETKDEKEETKDEKEKEPKDEKTKNEKEETKDEKEKEPKDEKTEEEKEREGEKIEMKEVEDDKKEKEVKQEMKAPLFKKHAYIPRMRPSYDEYRRYERRMHPIRHYDDNNYRNGFYRRKKYDNLFSDEEFPAEI